jgi:hypothetical protein
MIAQVIADPNRPRLMLHANPRYALESAAVFYEQLADLEVLFLHSLRWNHECVG